MNLIVEQWVKPYFDTTQWEHFDLSCKARDQSDDRVLEEAVKAGKRIAAIFKEPTITPSVLQVCQMRCRLGYCVVKEFMIILLFSVTNVATLLVLHFIFSLEILLTRYLKLRWSKWVSVKHLDLRMVQCAKDGMA